MRTRKEILTDKLVDYLLEHGHWELSLRPLAEAIDTSARLLIYHFESKEKLLSDVLASMQTRLRQSFGTLVEQRSSPTQRP